ncbi:MAG TPA: hypothetical protein VMV77_08950 [Bacteroidales bacterium]|nr:hypothetical protein [Bacteroidales bacterium]
MWIKFLNSKWFERLFSASIAIIVVLLTQRLISAREGENNIITELKNRPTYDYVDKQDAIINNNLRQHIDESAKTDEMLTKYIISIDGKINILLSNERKK